MFGDRLFHAASWILPLAGLSLAGLAYLRVRLTAEVEELTRRDNGSYWRSLPWEDRARYLRRFALVNWGFTIIILSTIIYGAWAAWWVRSGH